MRPHTALALKPREKNRLLAALPEDVYAAIEPKLEFHTLKRGVVVHKAGEKIDDLYFPLNCLISVTVTMRDGRTGETAVVGSREVVGLNAFMGGHETTQTEYVIQAGGGAVRIEAARLRAAFDSDERVRGIFLKCTQAMLAQLSQNVACNGIHTLAQRYARWLLEMRDRVHSDHLETTHVFVSRMLSVRRSSITVLAGKFEKAGLVQSGRGWIRILDPTRLQQAACECYAALVHEYDRLLGGQSAEPAAPVESRSTASGSSRSRARRRSARSRRRA